jgi:hypothetical protein
MYNNIYHLRTKPTQFAPGKTEETLLDISKRYLINSLSQDDHLLEIVFTNNSLAETEQWKYRANSTFSNSNGITIDILSSKSVNNKIEEYIYKLLTAETKAELPNILIICTHKKRIEDIIKLIQTFANRSYLNDPSGKIKFHISIDEPDANLGKVKNLIKGISKHVESGLITGILFITATPDEDFWKMLSKSKIHTLLNMNKDSINKFDDDYEKYRGFEDHTKIEHNNDTKNPLDYIKDVFDKKLINVNKRNIIFSPGHQCKDKDGVGSHREIIEFYNKKGYCVFCMNSDFKGFINPDNSRIDLQKFNSDNNIIGELRHSLKKWNELNPNMNLAITGFMVIERGITFNTDGFCFTEIILSNYHMSKENRLIQLIGRGTGGKQYVKKMTVICTTLIKNNITNYYNNLNEVCLLNPEHFNKADFTNDTTKTIPVKFTIEDSSLLNKIIEISTKGGKDKNKNIEKCLKEGIQENKITIEDQNNIRKLDIFTRRLNTVRMYINGQNKEARRFKSFNDAFITESTIAQQGDATQYNIDFAKDEFVQGEFIQPLNVFWVTYRC